MPKNPRRGHLGSINVFYKPKTSKKFKWYPLIKIESSRKKSHSAEKTQRRTLCSHLYFWKHKKIYGLVRE